MKHLLLTVDYPTNALIEPLCAKGFKVTVAGSKKEAGYLKNSGCSFLLLENSKINTQEINQMIESFHDQLDEEDLFKYRGQRLLESILTTEWDDLKSELSKALLIVEAVEGLHRKTPLHLIVVHEEVRLVNRTLLAFAKSHQIATLHLPHANLLCFSPYYRTILHGLLYADYQIFGNDRSAHYYSHCLKKNHFLVTGNPAFDRYANFNLTKQKKEARRRLKVRPEEKLVTFLSLGLWKASVQNEGFHHSIVTYRSLLLLSHSLGFQLICKLHPVNEEALHKEVETQISIPPYLRTVENLMGCIAAANWIVAYGSSNAVVEAVLMGQKVIVVDAFEGEPGIISVRSDPDEIKEALEKALRGDFDEIVESGREEFIRRFNVANDGYAAGRVVHFIESILPKRETKNQERVKFPLMSYWLKQIFSSFKSDARNSSV